MIRTPTLWNRIDNSMPLSMVSTCCDRQPTAYVEVDIDVESCPDPHVVAEFIRIAKQHSTRWKSFDYRCSYDSDDENEVALSGSEELKRETPGLEASSLTSLSIQHVNPPRSVNEDRFRDAVNFYSTWSTPRLSQMHVKNVILIPFVGAASLKKLDLDFTDCSGGRFNLKALFTFFASCVTLEELSMSFACELLDETSLPVKPFSFVHVRNLAVSFYDCPRKHVKLVMNHCLFPVVSRMSLQIERSYYVDGDVPDFPDLEDVDVDDVIPSIFSRPSRFPELEDLRLNVGRLSRQSYSSIQITLPFNNLPKVKRLSLMLNPESAAKVYVLIPKGECLPSLRSLSLINCASLNAGWIISFLGRLKAQGSIQMSQLTVTNCSWKAPPASTTAALDSEHPETMGGEEGPYVRVTADDLRQLMM
ncbi:hypothetical protein SCHPADRAFT_539903 [Schizopora paradoxa]|uniref:F-box domain-containing protein n=1 Tax=Schizopora paradoxa TaxID=27342 RepID=A0A0H2RZ16_9AGAM|nr:hypothetical protein SCHPADRAFT_539903 [Schizopora paradoxa]